MRRSSFTMITLTGGNDLLAGASQSRVGLVIGPGTLATEAWAAPRVMTGANQGLGISKIGGRSAMEVDTWGSVIGDSWYAWGTAGDTVAVVEVMEG